MSKMNDKLSFINRNSNGHVIGAGNVVGVPYAKAREFADNMEKDGNNHYLIVREENLYDVIQHFTDKSIEAKQVLMDVLDNIESINTIADKLEKSNASEIIANDMKNMRKNLDFVTTSIKDVLVKY